MQDHTADSIKSLEGFRIAWVDEAQSLSARSLALLRPTIGADMVLVTPGIRPAGAAAGDQKRIMTPAAAIAAGADHLVVGRPIIAAPDPKSAAEAIIAEIAAAARP